MKILMLVNNDILFDSRVKKMASTLAQYHEVSLLYKGSAHEVYDSKVRLIPLQTAGSSNLAVVLNICKFFLSHQRALFRYSSLNLLQALLFVVPTILYMIIATTLQIFVQALWSIFKGSSIIFCKAQSVLQRVFTKVVEVCKYRSFNFRRFSLSGALRFIKVRLKARKQRINASCATLSDEYAFSDLPRFAHLPLLGPLYHLLKACKSRVVHAIAKSINHLAESNKTFLISLDCFANFYDHVSQEQFDVLHVNDLETLTLAVELKKRHQHVNIICDIHELETDRNDRQGFRNRFFAWAELRKHLKSCSRVFTVSSGIARELEKIGGRGVSVDVVYNTPIYKAVTRAATIRADLNLQEDQNLMVYVGLITDERKLDVIVSALKLLPSLHLAFVGPANIQYKEKLIVLADKLGVSSRFHLLDAVPNGQVISYIATADVGVALSDKICRSYEYALPNKFFEMTLSGIPIVITDHIEMGNLLRNKLKNGLAIAKNDEMTLAKAVNAVLNDVQQYKPSPERLEEIINEFSWQAQESKIMEAYSSLDGASCQQPVAEVELESQ